MASNQNSDFPPMGRQKLHPVDGWHVDQGAGVIWKLSGQVVEPFEVASTMALGG